MKKLLVVTIAFLGSFSFGQTNEDFRDGDPAYLIPTEEQQRNGQCNENAVFRETWIDSGHTVVKCTGSDGIFYLYVLPKNGGGTNLPGTEIGPVNPGGK